MSAQCSALRKTSGSGLGFIRHQLQLAVNILPRTYPLIALLLHKEETDGCIFDALYFFQLAKFAGSVAMCPMGILREADHLNRAKMSLDSLTIRQTKNTLDARNKDWIVQM